MNTMSLDRDNFGYIPKFPDRIGQFCKKAAWSGALDQEIIYRGSVVRVQVPRYGYRTDDGCYENWSRSCSREGNLWPTGRLDRDLHFKSVNEDHLQELSKRLAAVGKIENISSGPAQPSRTILLTKSSDSFGFVLCGAKSCNMELTEHFTPTLAMPALQYVEKVESRGIADEAGLEPGDFILEVNGECVIQASHEYVVGLISAAGNALILKVTKSVGTVGNDRSCFSETGTYVKDERKLHYGKDSSLVQQLQKTPPPSAATTSPPPPANHPKTCHYIKKVQNAYSKQLKSNLDHGKSFSQIDLSSADGFTSRDALRPKEEKSNRLHGNAFEGSVQGIDWLNSYSLKSGHTGLNSNASQLWKNEINDETADCRFKASKLGSLNDLSAWEATPQTGRKTSSPEILADRASTKEFPVGVPVSFNLAGRGMLSHPTMCNIVRRPVDRTFGKPRYLQEIQLPTTDTMSNNIERPRDKLEQQNESLSSANKTAMNENSAVALKYKTGKREEKTGKTGFIPQMIHSQTISAESRKKKKTPAPLPPHLSGSGNKTVPVPSQLSGNENKSVPVPVQLSGNVNKPVPVSPPLQLFGNGNKTSPVPPPPQLWGNGKKTVPIPPPPPPQFWGTGNKSVPVPPPPPSQLWGSKNKTVPVLPPSQLSGSGNKKVPSPQPPPLSLSGIKTVPEPPHLTGSGTKTVPVPPHLSGSGIKAVPVPPPPPPRPSTTTKVPAPAPPPRSTSIKQNNAPDLPTSPLPPPYPHSPPPQGSSSNKLPDLTPSKESCAMRLNGADGEITAAGNAPVDRFGKEISKQQKLGESKDGHNMAGNGQVDGVGKEISKQKLMESKDDPNMAGNGPIDGVRKEKQKSMELGDDFSSKPAIDSRAGTELASTDLRRESPKTTTGEGRGLGDNVPISPDSLNFLQMAEVARQEYLKKKKNLLLSTKQPVDSTVSDPPKVADHENNNSCFETNSSLEHTQSGGAG